MLTYGGLNHKYICRRISMTKYDPLVEGYLARRRAGKKITTDLLCEDGSIYLDDNELEVEIVEQNDEHSVARILAEEPARRWACKSLDENISVETTPAPSRKLSARERILRAQQMNWGGEDE
jgi:hypothetical protein